MNLERLLGPEPLRISDDRNRAHLVNQKATAECDQIGRHIYCGPGTNLETVIHELGHVAEYHWSPAAVLGRQRASQTGTPAEPYSGQFPPSDPRFREMDEEFLAARAGCGISEYARTNPCEWFAESFMFYFTDPVYCVLSAPQAIVFWIV